MEIENIKGSTSFFDGTNCIGVYHINAKQVVLIDSGSDDSIARKMLNYFKDRETEIKAIICTHSHADHCGGNQFIQKRSGCQIYTSRIEGALMLNPEIEPLYLFNSYPVKELQNKFLQAKPTETVQLIEEGELIIDHARFIILDLGGHSPGMIGVITEDAVAFIGDCMLDIALVDKYKLIFNYDLKKTLVSMEKAKNLNCDSFVLSHGGLKKTIAEIADYNKKRFEKINDIILEYSDSARSKEDYLSILVKTFEIKHNPSLYYLNHSITSAHLAYLVNEGLMEMLFESEMIKFMRKNN